MSPDALYDITIVGGGPVGLFASFYAGMRGMSTKIVDSLPELGGQLAALYPEKYVYDMPGFPRILARDLAGQMLEQGTRFAPAVALSERVQTLTRDGDAFTLGTDRAEHRSRSVVICAGAGAFAPKRLNVPGIEAFEGRGVHYFVRSRASFAGQRILIVGGGDSALDWAMNLEPVAQSLTLIHRRDVFRAHEESVDWLLNRSGVDTRLFWELQQLEGGGRLEKVTIGSSRTGETEEVPVDACLINIGFTATLGPIKDWGLTLLANQIVVNSHMETSVPGVYAAGDVCTYEGKLKLIATGVGEACVAVNYAKHHIDPSARVFPGHSSNLDL